MRLLVLRLLENIYLGAESIIMVYLTLSNVGKKTNLFPGLFHQDSSK